MASERSILLRGSNTFNVRKTPVDSFFWGPVSEPIGTCGPKKNARAGIRHADSFRGIKVSIEGFPLPGLGGAEVFV